MIECGHLVKKYGKKTALEDVSFKLKKGIYGLIGENGAGKSTLFRMLIGQEKADSGTIKIDGETPDQGKLRIGYLPQKFDFFQNLTVYEGLDYIATLKGIKDNRDKEIDYWLRQLNLYEQRKKKIKVLSGGMKQRLGIGQAFLGKPDYVILDEPTVGLDPKERLAFRNLVNEIGANTTILIATHIIEDVEAACENILVLNRGKVIYGGKAQDFIQNVKEEIYSVRIPREQIGVLNKKVNIISIKLFGDELEVRYAERNSVLDVSGKRRERCNLEDAYFLATEMIYKKGECHEGS